MDVSTPTERSTLAVLQRGQPLLLAPADPHSSSPPTATHPSTILRLAPYAWRAPHDLPLRGPGCGALAVPGRRRGPAPCGVRIHLCSVADHSSRLRVSVRWRYLLTRRGSVPTCAWLPPRAGNRMCARKRCHADRSRH